MDSIIAFVSPLFWGVFLLSLLVFVHEGGHFLAARACGVRVTEFFLGLPCRFNIHHESRRIGTKFGITPLLLGGYAAICGMDPEEDPHAAEVLFRIHEAGELGVEDLASELGISSDEALESCVFLMNMGSIAPVYDPEKGEKPSSKFYPTRYAALPRDASGYTVFDGRAFDREHATGRGEPWIAPSGAQAFYEAERSHTYLGVGFWKRALMLVAGIAVNLFCGVLLFVIAYSAIGIKAPVDANVLGSITAGSPAEEAGVSAGDRILAVDGKETDTWSQIIAGIDDVRSSGADGCTLTVWHPDDDAPVLDEEASGDSVESYLESNGSTANVEVAFDKEGMLGIGVSYETVRLAPLESAGMALEFLRATAEGVSRLLMPQHTIEVLDNSTSVVGISVMSAEAAQQGASSFLSLAALISFSLGFMNLLPIPPLDGGKLLIEAVQAVTRRKVPIKVQLILSYIGIALFGFLFLYMLRADILRLL